MDAGIDVRPDLNGLDSVDTRDTVGAVRHGPTLLQTAVRRIDTTQRRHPVLAFPVAVAKKLGDDDAGREAAVIAHRAFLSMFPLLLVFVTVLGFALHDNPELQDRVLSSALSGFPVVGPQLRSDIHTLNGSGIALAIGLAGTLYGGIGVGQALESALDSFWSVPRRDRPGFPRRQVRALLALVAFGVAIVASTVLVGYATVTISGGPAARVAAVVMSGAVNFAVFAFAFRKLTAEPLRLSDVAVGALVATIGWTLLQAIGGWYVGRELQGASALYGYFAVVIALLAWLHLGAMVLLVAVEVDVVRRRHLWPRSLQRTPTATDQTVYRLLAGIEQRLPGERVTVAFEAPAPPSRETV